MQGLDTVLKHPHLCTTNINVFEYAGRKYEWYHRRLVGDVYICYDAETRDVMAMCKLRFDIKAVKQIVTAWGLRCASLLLYKCRMGCCGYWSCC